jgi:UPF0716 family protein affecting phage T7 exclusion
MTFLALPTGRLKRAAFLLIAGWLVLEYALMQLVAARIGWGATLAFLSVKGGVGLLLVGMLTAQGLRRLGRKSVTGAGSSLGFGVVSGVLITLPGLAPTLVGIALFAPSVRSFVLRRFKPAQAQPAPRNIDLEEHQYRELRTRRIAKRTKSRRAIPQTDALEAKPPSV